MKQKSIKFWNSRKPNNGIATVRISRCYEFDVAELDRHYGRKLTDDEIKSYAMDMFKEEIQDFSPVEDFVNAEIIRR